MGLPTPDEVDFGRNLVFAVTEMACYPGPPYLRMVGNRVVGGFEEPDNPVVCEAESEYHAAFSVARAMLPAD